MDENMLREAKQNKAIRGYIIRSLVKGHQNTLMVHQLSNALVGSNMIVNPDIGNHIKFLADEGYITVSDGVKPADAYLQDASITLANKGVRLVEGSLTDDMIDL